jgi:hypothetical protein
MLLTFIFTDESRFVLVLWVAGIRSLSGGHGSSIPSKSFSENWPPLERTSIHSFISLSNLASTGIIFNWKLNHPFYLACQKAWPKESMLEHNVPQHKSATCCCLAILQVFCWVTNYNPIERYGTVVFFHFFSLLGFRSLCRDHHTFRKLMGNFSHRMGK